MQPGGQRSPVSPMIRPAANRVATGRDAAGVSVPSTRDGGRASAPAAVGEHGRQTVTPSRVAASGSKSSGRDAIGATVDSTSTNARRSTDSSTATIVSSTW